MTRRLVLGLAFCLPAVSNAQGIRVSGTVVRSRNAPDLPVPDAEVILHRITDLDAAAVDSTRTDGTGAYRFARPAGDTAGRLVVTVRHDGVAYVSDAAVVRGRDARIARLAVYDTSSAAAVTLAQRHVLVRAADTDGSRAVLELLVLRNAGDRTRVAPAGSLSWRMRLLAGATDALIPSGEGDVAIDAVHFAGDTLGISAPLPPGDRQVVVSYVVPATDRVALSGSPAVEELTLMLADTLAVVRHGPVTPVEVLSFEGARYLRLEAKHVSAGDTVLIDLPPAPMRAEGFWWVVVAVSAGVLVVAAVRRWR